MEFDIFTMIRKELDEQIDKLSTQAKQGWPQDFAAYQKLVGSISSYELIKDFVDELEKKYLEQ